MANLFATNGVRRLGRVAAAVSLAAALVAVTAVAAAGTVPALASAPPTTAVAAAGTVPALASAPPTTTAAQKLPAPDRAALREAISHLESEATGALVRISGSAGCWRGTAGYADVHTRAPVPHDARFRIGSMTKVFTATVVLQLDQQGLLDLDEHIQHYLPGVLPAAYKPITVRQVLNYTSGVQYLDLPHKDPTWFLAHRFDTWTPEQLVELATRGKQPLFDPGTEQNYGNINYILAGMLIEKVTGHDYEDEIRDRILRPLRLNDTSVPRTERRILGPHARGYELGTDGAMVDVTEANPSYQWAAASMISSARDLDTFLTRLFQGRLLPAAQLAEMFTVPAVRAYDGDDDPTTGPPATHGASLTSFGGQGGTALWGKTGDRPGYNNGMGATRDLQRVLVYSVNTIHMGRERPKTADRIAAAAFPAPRP